MAGKGPIARFRWWWRRRPLRVSVWDAAKPERWAMLRDILLAERGLSDEEANDVNVP